ncbi:hypothetical protein GCM10011371_30140 [Novosphingobium marinum]|uniref:D-amino-acid oxidase n=1 Tax=Novosphingobium marinum TaxID=1514948 RepID=A0A7Z0BUX9_9SPHN|nr:FAD-dependent oxidoreductase [Novosphingobium marinum]NYH96724.1 hypothetical protein [Novosphingobium marinum]GGC40677.1 hypothetical protein GCM10011371_30140 [Novosphingobium marinum]
MASANRAGWQSGMRAMMSTLSRRNLIASGLGAALAGCASPRFSGGPSIVSGAAYGFGELKPLDLSVENLVRITVCTRPFRPAGPRLDAVNVGDRLMVHNYGHGGSGWSLSWGYAEAVHDLLAVERPRSVAVLGAGCIGLTTAIALAETGAKVTIFAREFPMESPSARATGVWSPSSRIGLEAAVSPGFAARWEVLARNSYARHLRYVGRIGAPVEFTPRFYVRSARSDPPLVAPPRDGDDFLALD